MQDFTRGEHPLITLPPLSVGFCGLPRPVGESTRHVETWEAIPMTGRSNTVASRMILKERESGEFSISDDTGRILRRFHWSEENSPPNRQTVRWDFKSVMLQKQTSREGYEATVRQVLQQEFWLNLLQRADVAGR